MSEVEILSGVVAGLTATIGFLGAFLLKRLAKGNDLLIAIDKKVAVMNVEIDHNKKDVERQDREKHKQGIELFEMRSNIKSVEADINNLKNGE